MIQPKDINILIACEESQAVVIEFRRLGFNAFSCDIQECSGGHPEWHIQGDVLCIIKPGCFFKTQDKSMVFIDNWSCVIGFPPCTHLASSGAVYWKQKQEDGRQEQAIDFVMEIYNSNSKVCIENPSGILSTIWRKPNQIINPFQFGDPYRKRTCLWVKGLPELKITPELLIEPIASWHSGSTRGGIKKDGTRTKSKLPALKSGSKSRSKTFPGIAKAMAEQWGAYLLKELTDKE